MRNHIETLHFTWVPGVQAGLRPHGLPVQAQRSYICEKLIVVSQDTQRLLTSASEWIAGCQEIHQSGSQACTSEVTGEV